MVKIRRANFNKFSNCDNENKIHCIFSVQKRQFGYSTETNENKTMFPIKKWAKFNKKTKSNDRKRKQQKQHSMLALFQFNNKNHHQTSTVPYYQKHYAKKETDSS